MKEDNYSVISKRSNKNYVKKKSQPNFKNRKKSRKSRILKKEKRKERIPIFKSKTPVSRNNEKKNLFYRDHPTSVKQKKSKEAVKEKPMRKISESKNSSVAKQRKHFFTLRSQKQKENQKDGNTILSNKASSLLKKIFKKSTKKIQKKQILKSYEQSQRNSSYSSQNSQRKNLPTYHDYTNLCDFSKYFEINFTQIAKIKNIDILKKSRKRLHTIYEIMKKSKNPYEAIRSYTNDSQNMIFEDLPMILKDRKAQSLLGKMLKFERWSIILIFYFRVAEIKNEELSKILLVLIEHVWKNQNNLFCWLRILKKKYNIEMWDLSNELKRVKDVDYDVETLIIRSKKSCKFISGFLIKT